MINDPIYDLRKAYFSRLNGQISHKGEAVPVYEMAPLNANGIYILLNKQTASDRATKDDEAFHDSTMSILVVEHLEQGNRTYANIDKVGNQVLGRLQDLEVPGYKVVSHVLEFLDNSPPNKTDTGVEVMKLIRFRNLIEKL